MKDLRPYQIRRHDDPRRVNEFIAQRNPLRVRNEQTEKDRQVEHYTGMLAELEQQLAFERAVLEYAALMFRLCLRQK